MAPGVPLVQGPMGPGAVVVRGPWAGSSAGGACRLYVCWACKPRGRQPSP